MAANETKDAMLSFLRTCRERHVPFNVYQEILLALPKNMEQAKREEWLWRECEKIRQEWPFIPMEEYLAQIEASKDWRDLQYHRCVYWQDVPSMLADAVRTRSVQTVRQLALHCLFNNTQLKEEMLALAPDARTRKALLYPPRVKEEEHYRQYPFCVVANDIVGIYESNVQRRNMKIISLPSDIQDVLFDKILRRKRYTAEQFADWIIENRIYQDGAPFPTMWEHRLFCLGYEVTEDGWSFSRIPEGWYHHSYTKNDDWPNAEIYGAGVSGLLAELVHQGWKVKFDGLRNWFGSTGYFYLTQWP